MLKSIKKATAHVFKNSQLNSLEFAPFPEKLQHNNISRIINPIIT